MKNLWLASTVLGSLAWALPAQAQDSATVGEVSAESGNDSDGTIVVTARKREETLQSVPAAVTAASQQTLTRAGASNLADVARLTPGLTFNAGNAGGLAAPSLRGVTNITTTTFDNNVGVFLDGVYLSAKSNLDIDLFNLARVEVIKGPQSALYGNNAFAGAINYVLEKPSETLSGRVRASSGGDGFAEVAGKISVPLGDTLSALLVGSYSTYGGTVRNVSGGKLGGWDHKVSGAATLNFHPGGGFEASAFYYHYEDELDGGANYMFTNDCGGTTTNSNNRGGSNRRFRCGDLTAPASVNVDPASVSRRKTDLAIGRVAYDFGPMALRYTGSYAKYSTYALQDQHLNSLGGLPSTSRRFTQPFVGPVREWSQELRAESYGNSFFDWAVGGYYYDRQASQITVVGVGPNQTPKSLDQENIEFAKMKSVFALGSFKLTSALEIEAQGRWTWEDKRAQLTNRLTGLVLKPEASFSYGTYRVTANYKATETNLLYAVIASGTKSGGFNNTAVVIEQSFGPEKNTTYEIGSKNTFFDGSAVLNLSAFYVDWKNLQLSVPSAVAGQTNPVTNIGSASVKGFEASVALKPFSGLDLSGGYAYADAKWDKGTIDFSGARICPTAAVCGLTQAGIGIDVGGFQIPRTSKHQISGAATYTFAVGDAEIYLRGDVSYRSHQPTNALALQYTEPQTLVNTRIGFLIDKFEFALFARNLFNKYYIVSSINEPEFVPATTFTTGFVGNGRLVGASVELRF